MGRALIHSMIRLFIHQSAYATLHEKCQRGKHQRVDREKFCFDLLDAHEDGKLTSTGNTITLLAAKRKLLLARPFHGGQLHWTHTRIISLLAVTHFRRCVVKIGKSLFNIFREPWSNQYWLHNEWQSALRLTLDPKPQWSTHISYLCTEKNIQRSWKPIESVTPILYISMFKIVLIKVNSICISSLTKKCSL